MNAIEINFPFSLFSRSISGDNKPDLQQQHNRFTKIEYFKRNQTENNTYEKWRVERDMQSRHCLFHYAF